MKSHQPIGEVITKLLDFPMNMGPEFVVVEYVLSADVYCPMSVWYL